jgi:hypothetical protein
MLFGDSWSGVIGVEAVLCDEVGLMLSRGGISSFRKDSQRFLKESQWLSEENARTNTASYNNVVQRSGTR